MGCKRFAYEPRTYYDPNGKLVGLNYNGDAYFYIRNVQGEIIKLISEAGAVVVEYTYDAWGNVLSVTGSMASTLGEDNPFRYKGYYYDSETSLYYLNSRYYNPEWGRFISADSVLGKTGDLVSHNLYVYCCNNPIIMSDSTGHDAVVILDTNELTHMSLLIQNDNKWYYYFYGSNRRELMVISDDYADEVMDGIKEGKMDDLNNWVKDITGWEGTYEKALYLEGDFENSYEAAEEIINAKENSWNLFGFNCMQTSVALLYLGEINGRRPEFWKCVLYYSRIHPGDAYNYMEKIGFLL